MKKRKLFPLLFTMLIIFVLSFGGELKVFAKEPTPQPGTNSYKGTSGSYNRIGFSMLIDGYNYTTSIGDNDAAYVSSSDTTKPLYPNEFQVVLENGARYIRGSVRVKMANGSTKYMNYNIVLHPKNFNPNSAVIGRSLLDNIFLESGVNKTTLANKLSQGNTVAWINAIISIRTPSGARSTHAEIKQNRLWYQGKNNYTSYPDRVYSTSAIKNALPWSTQTLNAFDSMFNNKYTLPAIYEVDRTAPSGTFSPNSKSWTNSNVSVTFTPSDSGSGVKQFRYRISTNNGSTYGSWSSWYTTSSKTISLTSQGRIKIQAEVHDKAGNTATITSGTYYIDKTAPTATFSPNSSNWTNQKVVTVITPSDSLSGVKRMRWNYSVNNGKTWGTWSDWIEGSSPYSLPITVAGERKIKVEVEDNAGNKKEIESGTFYIDMTAPEGTLIASPTSWTNGNVVITAKGSDSGGSGFYRIKRPDGTYVNGTTATYTATSNGTYTFYFYDKAGNETAKSITISNIDKSSPTVTFSPKNSNWTNKDINVVITPSDVGSGVKRMRWRTSADDGGTYGSWSSWIEGSSAYTLALTTEGRRKIQIEVEDNVGNTGIITSETYYIDKTNPSGTLSLNSTNWTNGSVTINAAGSDSLSGIDKIKKPDGTYATGSSTTYTVNANGTYSFVFYDKAGNETIKSITVSNIDKTAPTGTLSANPTTWTNGNVVITASGSDSGGSGFYRIKKPDGTYEKGNKATYTVSTNGTYTFEFYDNAGNSTTKTVNVTNIDKTAPTGTLTPSTTNWTNKDIVITATGSDAESGISKIEKPDGTFEQGSSTTYTVSENGTYKFVFYDNAGNKTSKSITIDNIDKIAPIGILRANPTTWTKGEVVITATGSDTDSGMYRIKKPDGTYATGSSTTYTVSKNGDYTFIFYDNAGNYTEKTIKISNIDKDNPSGTFSPNSSNWTKENIAVTFTPTDNGSGVYRWRYRISTDNGTTYGNWSSYIEGGKASTITLSASGKNKIQVEVVDNAGNSTIITSGVYQIDKENPSAVFAPNSQAEWTNNNISVNVKVSDTLSGVKRWRWRISKDNGNTYDSWESYITNPESTVVLDTEGRIKIQIEAEDNAGNVVTITSGTYFIDKTVPTGKEYNIGGDLYFDGTVYWIKQNGRANIKIRANDKLSLLESMILQLQSDTDSYRQNFNFTNNQSQVVKESNEIEFVSGAKTYESADKTDREVTFSVKPKIHGKEYSVYVYLKDYAGNIRNFYDTGLKFKVDGNAPILTVTKNPSGLTNGNVVLNAKASDADSGIKKIILPDGTEIAKDTAQFTVTKNGNYTFIAEDNLGHRTTVVVSVTNIDKTKPINASIVINNDDEFTNRQNVTLTLYAEDDNGVTHMRFRTNDGTWSSWIPYATSYDYTMASGYVRQGTNYVYVQFKDEAGNISEEVYDSIVLDSIAPIGGIEYDKSVVNTRNINLTISAYDVNPEQADIISGLDSVRFRELQNGVVKQDWTPWEKYQPVKNWTLSFGDGEKVIEMEIRDKAGNVARVSKTIILDTLFIEEAVFTNIVSPPPGNPELPTAEVVKVKKGRDFTFQVKTIGNPDEATYSFNGEVGKMDKIGDNLFEKTLRVPIDDETSGILPIYITVKRHSDNASKSTTLQVWIVLYIEDYDINLTN